MPDAAVNGALIHYEEAGSGPPLLLLHGGLGTALLHWWRELPRFAARFRVIAPDLRGYGRSSPPRDFPPDFYGRDAADMAALLTAAADEPAHVLGWSDGGIVALVLAATRPDLVRSLIVVGAQARLLPEERAGWPAMVDLSGWSEGARRRHVEAHGSDNWAAMLQRVIPGYAHILEAEGGEIVSRRLDAIRCPTLIIHGEDDPIVPSVHAQELHAAIAASRLHIYPHTGHLPQREHEADFHERASAFWDETEASDRRHPPCSR